VFFWGRIFKVILGGLVVLAARGALRQKYTISRSVGNNVFLGDLGVSLPILIKSAETHEEPEKISFGWFGH